MSTRSRRWPSILALAVVFALPSRRIAAGAPTETADRARAVAAALESANLRMRAKLEEAAILDRQGRHDEAVAALHAVEGIHKDGMVLLERLAGTLNPTPARTEPGMGRRRTSPPEVTIPTSPVVADSLRRLVIDAAGYLLSVQRADGWFRPEPIASAATNAHLEVAADIRPTALAVLALADAQAFHDEQGRVTAGLRLGVTALMGAQVPSGAFGDGQDLQSHALATWAVAASLSRLGRAAWTSDVRASLDRALTFSFDRRSDAGMWSAASGSKDDDWLVNAWMVAAIHEIVAIRDTGESAAQLTAALDLTRAGARAVEFGSGEGVGPGGRFARALLLGMPNERPSFTDGSTAPDRSLIAGGEEVALLLGTAYRFGRTEGFGEWREQVLDPERRRQRRDGPLMGSWDPVGAHALAHGRTFATACQLLAALVPYVPSHDPKGE